MITSILMLLQTLSGAMLIFFVFRFPLEALLVLILIFPEKVRRSWTLIPYIPYSFFRVAMLPLPC
jgi:cytochrome b subunit of formate dehydrogenase